MIPHKCTKKSSLGHHPATSKNLQDSQQPSMKGYTPLAIKDACPSSCTPLSWTHCPPHHMHAVPFCHQVYACPAPQSTTKINIVIKYFHTNSKKGRWMAHSCNLYSFLKYVLSVIIVIGNTILSNSNCVGWQLVVCPVVGKMWHSGSQWADVWLTIDIGACHL